MNIIAWITLIGSVIDIISTLVLMAIEPKERKNKILSVIWDIVMIWFVCTYLFK